MDQDRKVPLRWRKLRSPYLPRRQVVEVEVEVTAAARKEETVVVLVAEAEAGRGGCEDSPCPLWHRVD